MINRKEDKKYLVSSGWKIHYEQEQGVKKAFAVKGSSNGSVIDIAAVTVGGEY